MRLRNDFFFSSILHGPGKTELTVLAPVPAKPLHAKPEDGKFPSLFITYKFFFNVRPHAKRGRGNGFVRVARRR